MSGCLYESVSLSEYDHKLQCDKRTLIMYSFSKNKSVIQSLKEKAIRSKADADGLIVMVDKIEEELLDVTRMRDEKVVESRNFAEANMTMAKLIENQESQIMSFEAKIDDYKKKACLHYQTHLNHGSLKRK